MYSFLEQAMKDQGTDGVNYLWLLSANMPSGDWLYVGFPTSASFIRSGQMSRYCAMPDNSKKSTKKRKKGLGISKKQFHDLLDKDLQPIKKSDSE
jgi:hypothetical protein